MQARKLMLKTKSTNCQPSSLSNHTTSEATCCLKVHLLRCRREGENESFYLLEKTVTNEVNLSMNCNHQCHSYPMFHKLLRINVHMHPRTVLNISLYLNYPACNDD